MAKTTKTVIIKKEGKHSTSITTKTTETTTLKKILKGAAIIGGIGIGLSLLFGSSNSRGSDDD